MESAGLDEVCALGFELRHVVLVVVGVFFPTFFSWTLSVIALVEENIVFLLPLSSAMKVGLTKQPL
jgi:hypothetical protein